MLGALHQGTDPLYLSAEWSESGASAMMMMGGSDANLWDTPEEHPSAVTARTVADQGSPPVTLQDCMDTFCQQEELDESDSWYCTACKAHVRAEKKLDLWRLPEVLVVHLKRFSYSRYSRDKLDTEVEFPLKNLDLRACVPSIEGGCIPVPVPGDDNNNGTATEAAEPPVYDLFAVSNHFGGLGGGHYTAYCRLPGTEKWYTFDDSSVQEMDASGVKSPAAYVLFYRRRGAAEGDLDAAIEAAAKEAQCRDGAEDLGRPGNKSGSGGLLLFDDQGPSSNSVFHRQQAGSVLEQVGEVAEEEEFGAHGGAPAAVVFGTSHEGDEPAGATLTAHALGLPLDIDVDEDDDDLVMGGIS